MDVDLLVDRADFPRAVPALEAAGFVHAVKLGINMFLDGPDGKVREANSFARNSIAGIYVEGNSLGSTQSGNTFATTNGQRNRVNIARARNARGV